MANNIFQAKRTNVSGRTPNTTGSYVTNSQYIAAGEFALNMADGILYSSNGSAVIEIGANNTNQRITNSLTVNNARNLNFQTINTSAASYFTQQNDDNFVFYSTNTAYGARAVWGVFANSITSNLQIYIPLQLNSGLVANGSLGSDGQVLTTNGTIAYWKTIGGTGTVTSVGSGDGLTGGPITGSGTLSVLANNGIISNSTGVFVFGNTGLVVNSTGVHVNGSYIQNTDSRTLSGNLVISGTYFNPSANTILLGNTTQRWVLAANSGDFSSTVNAVTSVNSALITVGTAFTANSTLVNAAAINVVGRVNTATFFATTSANVGTAFVANTIGVTTTGFVNSATVVNAASHTVGTAFTANSTLVNAAAINVTGQINTSTFYATSANVLNKIQLGTPGAFSFGANAIIEIDANQNTYTQIVVQNANTGNNASSDLVVTADTGNDSVDYIDLGINNSLYNQPTYNIIGAKDGYLYASNGSLSIGTLAAKEVILHANGSTSTDRKLTVNATAITIANSVTLVANGSAGVAGYVLTSNGATGSPYWSQASGGGGVYLKGGTATVGSLATEGQNIFRVNANTLNNDTTIATGENAQATGPLTVASGKTLTIQTGARVAIV